MSGSFLLVKMDAFPDANMSSIDAPYQHVLGEDFADLDPPHTVFNFSRRISELNIRVYHCTHEERVNKQGRYGNVNFPFYIGKYTFSSYYAEEQNILIIKTSKQIAKRAIRQLSKHEAVDYSTRDIDLMSIKGLVKGLKGAYLTVDDSPDINSVAFWGPSVDSDIRFDKAMAEGSIYNMRLDYDFKGSFFHIGVSQDMGVVLYDSQMDEQTELKLIFDIKRTILDKAKPKT